MSISGVSSVSPAASAYGYGGVQDTFRSAVTAFQAIGNALQSGNISAAQTAFASLQKDLPAMLMTLGNQPFSGNSQANAHLQNLTTTLKSGDLVGAQTAFAALQNDLKMLAANAQNSATAHSHSSFENIINGLLKVVSS